MLRIDSFNTLENGYIQSKYLKITKQSIADSILHIQTSIDTFSVKLDFVHRRIDIHERPPTPRIIVIFTNYAAFD